MSSKSLLLVLLLTITWLSVKSQTLLNADFSKIKKEVKLKGGGLNKSFIEKNIEMTGNYKKIVFSYPLPPEGNSCLMKTSFCLTLKNKCFKYYEDYWGEELANKKIKELQIYYPDLKRVKVGFRWVDINKKFEVDLIPKKTSKNKFASIYILEIKQI
ncbi:MAG: hypothetical protein ACXVAY_14045 [Mucilaginibacter sp.]